MSEELRPGYEMVTLRSSATISGDKTGMQAVAFVTQAAVSLRVLEEAASPGSARTATMEHVRRGRDTECRKHGIAPEHLDWTEEWFIGEVDDVRGMIEDRRLTQVAW